MHIRVIFNPFWMTFIQLYTYQINFQILSRCIWHNFLYHNSSFLPRIHSNKENLWQNSVIVQCGGWRAALLPRSQADLAAARRKFRDAWFFRWWFCHEDPYYLLGGRRTYDPGTSGWRKRIRDDPDWSEPAQRPQKIGVANVNDRIQLNFGREYGLKIDSHPGEGTTCTLTLPKLYADTLSQQPEE